MRLGFFQKEKQYICNYVRATNEHNQWGKNSSLGNMDIIITKTCHLVRGIDLNDQWELCRIE